MTLQEAILIIKNQANKEINKVKIGLAARDVLRAALKESKDVDNARTQWLNLAADMVILLLRDEARKYNRKHKNERLSVLDLGDALATAKARLGIPAETGILTNEKSTKTS
jgi:hypothetical protein